MTTPEEYYAKCRALMADLDGTLTPEETAEVFHLIDHGEPAEGLRTLAWIIVEEGKQVPASVIVKLRELVDGPIDPEHLPRNLNRHAIPRR